MEHKWPLEIDELLNIHPRKLPDAPQDVIQYLLLDSKGRMAFNAEHPGYWNMFISQDDEERDFFSILRVSLAHNMEWVNIFTEEMKKPVNKDHLAQLTAKIKEFYRELYVGPLVGSLPYFRKWADIDSNLIPAQRNQNWND